MLILFRLNIPFLRYSRPNWLKLLKFLYFILSFYLRNCLQFVSGFILFSSKKSRTDTTFFSLQNLASVLASAMKNDDLEAFGERIYSSALLKMALTDIAPSLDHSGFIHSVSRVTRMISGALGEVNGTVDTVSCITAVESLIGCSIKYDKDEMVDAHLTDVHSTVSILLCLLSICRRLSVDRDAVMRIDSSHEHAKYTITFSSVSDTLGELDCECIDFCKELATRIEMPLSVELGGKSFGAEFVPYRVDPSLYGLKAGVNIKFNCED